MSSMNQCIIGITYLFIIYLITYTIYLFIITIIENVNHAKYLKRQKLSNRLKDDYYIPVSILLTTSNDEKIIVEKVKELLSLKYKSYEIIIIDSNSKDKTCEKLIKQLELQKIDRPIRKVIKTKEITEIYQTIEQGKRITLLKKEDGGKADAINAGINAASYPYLISIDTSFSWPTNILENLFSPILENDNVVACSGITEIGKIKRRKNDQYNYCFPKNYLEAGQVLEYSKASFLTKEKELDLVGLKSLTLLKKDAVLAVLGHDPNSTGENFELIGKIKESYALQKEECNLKCAPNAVCFIETQKNMGDIQKTREMWQQSLIQNKARRKKEKKQHHNKLLYWVFLWYELYAPFIKGIGFISTLVACILHLINVHQVLLFFLSYLIVTGTLAAYTLEENLQGSETKIGTFQLIYSALIERTILSIGTFFPKLTALFRSKK